MVICGNHNKFSQSFKTIHFRGFVRLQKECFLSWIQLAQVLMTILLFLGISFKISGCFTKPIYIHMNGCPSPLNLVMCRLTKITFVLMDTFWQRLVNAWNAHLVALGARSWISVLSAQQILKWSGVTNSPIVFWDVFKGSIDRLSFKTLLICLLNLEGHQLTHYLQYLQTKWCRHVSHALKIAKIAIMTIKVLHVQNA